MLQINDLTSYTLAETIAYTKQKGHAKITIIDNVAETEFEYVTTVAQRLSLYIFRITDTAMVAIANDTAVARKLAEDIHKKCQTMYYDYVARPKASIAAYFLTGNSNGWQVIKDNGYVVTAYNESGIETTTWLSTDIADTLPPHLDLKPYSIDIRIKGSSKRCNETILELSKQNYISGGSYSNERNCYYPPNNSKQYIARVNKLNKLFTKWVFKSL